MTVIGIPSPLSRPWRRLRSLSPTARMMVAVAAVALGCAGLAGHPDQPGFHVPVGGTSRAGICRDDREGLTYLGDGGPGRSTYLVGVWRRVGRGSVVTWGVRARRGWACYYRDNEIPVIVW